MFLHLQDKTIITIEWFTKSTGSLRHFMLKVFCAVFETPPFSVNCSIFLAKNILHNPVFQALAFIMFKQVFYTNKTKYFRLRLLDKVC